MPFSDVSEVPSFVKKYSPKVQRQWLHVFNSTFRKVKRETKSEKEAERRAFRAANSVLKRRFSQSNSRHENLQHDSFVHELDKYLGNLVG